MATPTIIIGIGTSGMKVIEHAQKFYYENYRVNKPANVEYIYLETNADNEPEGTPVGNDIIRVYISLEDMAKMIEDIKSYCNNPQWLPEAGTVLTAGLGAGGIRSCGRLALWGNNDKSQNFTTVIDAIKTAYAKVLNVNNNDATNKTKPSVFITGSLTGGTGAGILIDMGYVVRHLIKNIEDLYGLFLLPSDPRVVRGYEVMYGNTYGAIKDLHYFNNEKTTYKEKWTNGANVEYQQPPYELVQLISQDYKDGSPAIRTLSGLYKMAGLYLFLNIAGIYEKRRERLVDASGNRLIGKYGTFGLSAIQFPKDSISDYLVSDLCIELLKRLTNANQYYQNGIERQIDRSQIKNKIKEQFDNILQKTFDILNNPNRDLVEEIYKEVVNINSNNIKGDKTEYIINLFTSIKDDNFYATINNNIKVAQDHIIDGIYDLIDETLETTQNLYYAKFVLEDLVENLGKVLKYWQDLGLSLKAQNWDNLLRKSANGATKSTYKTVFEENAVLNDRLLSIFDLMKMHLTIPTLLNIGKHITEGIIKMEGADKTKDLPKIKFFEDAIINLVKVIGKIDDKDYANNNFERRKRDIKAELADQTLPILRVYPSRDFNQECIKARQTFNHKSGVKVQSMKTVTNGKLLQYFKEKQSGKFIDDIYNDFSIKFRKYVDFLNCIEDYDITTYIKENDENRNKSCLTANKSNSPFLKVTKTFLTNNYLPHFIVADDVYKIDEIIKLFEKNTDFSYKESSGNVKVELKNLKNIIVFYDEKGNYTPFGEGEANNYKDGIPYMKQMKECYEKRPVDLADANETNESWKKKREAYTTPPIKEEEK